LVKALGLPEGLGKDMGTILARDMRIVINEPVATNGKPATSEPVKPKPQPQPVPVKPVQSEPVQAKEKTNPWLVPLAAGALALGALGAGAGLASLLDDDTPPTTVIQHPSGTTAPQTGTIAPDWKARAFVTKPEQR
jgi:hypothetical protein